MEIYPAIDLMQGRCVRLTEGDFDARTDYADDPADVAASYEQAGARWLHLVDLDGARDPARRQVEAIKKLASSIGLKIQTGGGVRSIQDVETLLGLGASRVVIGSLCVKNPDLTLDMLRRFGREKIVLALDVRGDGEQGYRVATAGWKDMSDSVIEEVIDNYRNHASHILCTDIGKDGRLEGPNVKLYRHLACLAPGLRFQASGGVANLKDLDQLKKTGVSGVIIGKALYEKRFTLQDAIASAG